MGTTSQSSIRQSSIRQSPIRQSPIQQSPIRWLAAGMLIVAACGSSDDDTGATEPTGVVTPPAASTSTPDAAPATTRETSDATGDGTSDATGDGTSDATAAETTAAETIATAVATTVGSGGDATGDDESGSEAAPGSPVVPASSVDLDAVAPQTAIVVVGDDALVYSVSGPGSRKCLAVLDEVLVEGRFVDESGEVMQTDGVDTGEFVLREGEDGELGLLVGDGINERAWGAGSTDIHGLDLSGGVIDEFDASNGDIRGSATMIDLLGGDAATVAVEFGVNCR